MTNTNPQLVSVTYSDFKDLKECSYRWYLLREKGLPRPKMVDQYHAIPGIVIQKVFEKWYNNEMYRPVKLPSGQKLPPDHVEVCNKLLDHYWEKELSRAKILWVHHKEKNRIGPDEMKEQLRQMIPHTLKAIKSYKLLGPYAKSEVKMQAVYRKYWLINGRADFRIVRTESETDKRIVHMILDGKAVKSKKSDSVDPQQLRFYSLIAHLNWTVDGQIIKPEEIPNALGFLYYRPDVAGSAETAIDWITCTKDDIQVLTEELDESLQIITKKKFEPNTDKCFMCRIKDICDKNKYAKPQLPELEGKGIGKIDEISF